MGQVIYLDVDDEITSAVARMRVAPTGGVVLVVPYGSRLASSRINFRLLAREGEALGRRLTIVTPDAGTRSLAASAGLATHATVLEYESAAAASEGAASAGGGGARGLSIREGGSPRGAGGPLPDLAPPGPVGGRDGLRAPSSAGPIPVVGPPRRVRINRRVVALGLAVFVILVAAIGAAASAFLPSVEITLTPVTESIGPLALTVTADPDAAAPDLTNLVVPARRLSLPVSVTARFPATGKQVIDTKATGAVTFKTCDTGGTHTIPAGAVIKTSDGIEFATAAQVRLDRAKLSGGPGGQTTIDCPTGLVAVNSVKSGAEANVAIGAIKVLPAGYDTIVLSVTNAAPTTGGLHQENPQVVQADIDAAQAVLRTSLAEAFAARVADPTIVPAGAALVPQTQRLGDATPSVDPTSLVSQTVAAFDFGLAATGTVLAVDPAPVAVLAEARIRAAVSPGYHLVTGSVKTTVDPPGASGQVVTFAVRVRAEQAKDLDRAGLLAQLRGRSIQAARSLLEAYGAVKITVWPEWVTSIPSDESRLRLTIADQGGPAASPGPSVSAGPASGVPAVPAPGATQRPSAAPSPVFTATPRPSIGPTAAPSPKKKP